MRIAIAAALVASTLAAAPVARASDVLDEVFACSEILEDQKRWDCFDATVAQAKAAMSAGDFAVVERADVEEAQRRTFGFSAVSIPAIFGATGNDREEIRRALPPEIDQMEYIVKKVKVGPLNRHTFTMKNGEVWLQVDDNHVRIETGEVNTARIRRAALGSYLMMLNDRGKAIRVERIE